jgi:hypothetical protein
VDGWVELEESMSAKKSGSPDLVLYERPVGASCYETHLIRPNGVSPLTFAGSICDSKLKWYWMSRMDSHAPPDAPREPSKERKMTLVTQAAIGELAQDLSEMDEDGYGLFVALFGCKGLHDSGGDEWLIRELKEFSIGGQGALDMVMIRLGDSPEYVYVKRDATEAARALLRRWNIDPAAAKKRRYSWLGVAKLENLFKL